MCMCRITNLKHSVNVSLRAVVFKPLCRERLNFFSLIMKSFKYINLQLGWFNTRRIKGNIRSFKT